MKWYRKAAEQGNAYAQSNLGDCYANGQGVTQDYAEAVKWYRKAAEQGNAYAQNSLGIRYVNGQGVTQDYAEAVKWYRKAAEQGNAYAQSNLGSCCYNGQGVTQDYAEAVKWYRKAAEQGNAIAQCGLGDCYFNGRGVTQDYTEAVKWYRKAVEQGNANAQNNLGDCYSNGWGVTQDYAEAVKWYRMAAEQGNAFAQSNLGDCYDKGQGAKQDHEEAVKWFRKAAEQGIVYARQIIAEIAFGLLKAEKEVPASNCLYFNVSKNGSSLVFAKWDVETNGLVLVPVDTGETAFPFTFLCTPVAAAKANKPEETIVFYEDPTDFYDGISVVFGDGSVKFLEGDFVDHAEAMEAAANTFNLSDQIAADLIKKATAIDAVFSDNKDETKNNTVTSSFEQQFDLAISLSINRMFSDSTNKEEKKNDSFYLLQKLAEQGYSPAQYMLYRYYENGDVVQADSSEAKKWFDSSQNKVLAVAKDGDVRAQFALGFSFNENENWLFMSAEQGYAPAQFWRGIMSDAHFLLEPSPEQLEKEQIEKVKWLRKAAEQNFPAAQYLLATCYMKGEGVEEDKTEAEKWYRKAAEQGHEEANKALKSF